MATRLRIPRLAEFLLAILSGYMFINVAPLYSRQATESADRNRDSGIVKLRVSVVDGVGQIVTRLSATAFHLFDDGKEKPITLFVEDHEPLSVSVIVSKGARSADYDSEFGRGVVEFVASLHEGDEYRLITFDEHSELHAKRIRTTEELEAELKAERTHGASALFDAMYLGISELRGAQGRNRVLLILSDGRSSGSRYTRQEVTELLRESDVQVFALAPSLAATYRVSSDALDARSSLSDLCLNFGGRMYSGKDKEEFAQFGSLIATELHHEYVIGFSPERADPTAKERWHKISIKLEPPKGVGKVTAAWRTTYLPAPAGIP